MIYGTRYPITQSKYEMTICRITLRYSRDQLLNIPDSSGTGTTPTPPPRNRNDLIRIRILSFMSIRIVHHGSEIGDPTFSTLMFCPGGSRLLSEV